MKCDMCKAEGLLPQEAVADVALSGPWANVCESHLHLGSTGTFFKERPCVECGSATRSLRGGVPRCTSHAAKQQDYRDALTSMLFPARAAEQPEQDRDAEADALAASAAKAAKREARSERALYGVFRRPRGSPKGTRWEQVPPWEGSKAYVVRAAQSYLIEASLEGTFEVAVRPL
jgi:hypothetical protein